MKLWNKVVVTAMIAAMSVTSLPLNAATQQGSDEDLLDLTVDEGRAYSDASRAWGWRPEYLIYSTIIGVGIYIAVRNNNSSSHSHSH